MAIPKRKWLVLLDPRPPYTVTAVHKQGLPVTKHSSVHHTPSRLPTLSYRPRGNLQLPVLCRFLALSPRCEQTTGCAYTGGPRAGSFPNQSLCCPCVTHSKVPLRSSLFGMWALLGAPPPTSFCFEHHRKVPSPSLSCIHHWLTRHR